MNRYLSSPLAIFCAMSALSTFPGNANELDQTLVSENPLLESLQQEQTQTPIALDNDSLQKNTEEPQKTESLSLAPDSASSEKKSPEKELYFDADSGEFFETESSLQKKTSTVKKTASINSLADPSLLAANNPPPQPETVTVEENDSFLSLGGSYTYTHITPHGNPSFHGNLGGLQGLYEYRPCNKFYGGLKLSWRQGETESSDATRFIVDVTAEERFGYTFAVNEDKWLWTLFSGIGYRYLGHHLKQSGDNLRFNYNEFYCPVGLFSDYQVYPFLSIGIHATWMPQFFPTVTIIPLSGARWAITDTFANTLVEMPFSFFAGKRKQFFLTVNPSFQYWQDGHSTAETSTGNKLGLPGNSYFFWGVDLNLGYAF